MIDVIIPAYNSEKYLPACLASLMNDNAADAEFILVDDGSTDETGAICNAFCCDRDNVRIIHRNNGGVSAARNAGVDAIVNSEPNQWVWFVDSDDVVAPEALNKLSYIVTKANTDAIYFGHVSFPDGEMPNWIPSGVDKVRVLNGSEFLSATYRFELDHYLHCFLFRYDSLEKYALWRHAHGMTKLCDESYSLLEDLVFVEEIMQYACRSVMVIPDVLYGYRQSTGSTVHATSPKAANSALRAIRYIDRFKVTDADRLAKRLMQLALLFNAYRFAGQSKDEKELREEIHREIKVRVHEIGLNRLPWRLLMRYVALESHLGDIMLGVREING